MDKGDSEQALPWLLWSLELLVGVGGVETQSMQVCDIHALDEIRADPRRSREINVLAALVEAYLDTSAGPSRLEKAENSILQLLVGYALLFFLPFAHFRPPSQRLQPTGALSRRRIKILIAREAGDSEIARGELHQPLRGMPLNALRL